MLSILVGAILTIGLIIAVLYVCACIAIFAIEEGLNDEDKNY